MLTPWVSMSGQSRYLSWSDILNSALHDVPNQCQIAAIQGFHVLTFFYKLHLKCIWNILNISLENICLVGYFFLKLPRLLLWKEIWNILRFYLAFTCQAESIGVYFLWKSVEWWKLSSDVLFTKLTRDLILKEICEKSVERFNSNCWAWTYLGVLRLLP